MRPPTRTIARKLRLLHELATTKWARTTFYLKRVTPFDHKFNVLFVKEVARYVTHRPTKNILHHSLKVTSGCIILAFSLQGFSE